MASPVHAVNTTSQRLRETTQARVQAGRQPVNNSRLHHHGFGKTAVHVHAVSPQVRAQVLATRPAIAADAAISVRLHRRQVAFLQALHARAHGIDDAGNLVAQHYGSGGRKLTTENVRVGAAETHRERPKAHLARPGIGHRKFIQTQVAGAVKAHRFHRRAEG